MKKVVLNLLFCAMAIFAYAGANDLVWDYTENKIPTSGPDNGLYYGSYVNDAPSSKNGYNGVKMNGSGYAYFTKAAVAGKLRLTFGPRSGNNATALEVYTWTGDTPSAETHLGTTKQVTESGSDEIEIAADVTNIYIKRNGSVETVLQKIEFKETVARSFVDFKIEFRDNPYTVILPEGGVLPTGVLVENTNYNGGQHGIYGGVITVPVDGTVKFTIGACQFSNTPIAVKKDGVDLTTVNNNTGTCGETTGQFINYVTYIYTGDAGVLTFTLAGNTYVPFFFAEASEVVEATITYKDQNGTELGTAVKYEGDPMGDVPYTVSDLPTIPEGYAFRGWFYINGKKVNAADAITGNTTVQAKVTPIETATVGSVQNYNFTSSTFYPEDHETVSTNGGSFHDGQHGWSFSAGQSISVQVAGNAVVNVSMCKYSATGWSILTDANGNKIDSIYVENNVTTDGAEASMRYSGAATTLTLTFPGTTYVHKISVYNVLDFLDKDATTGYYMVPAGDAASLLLALVQANGEGNAKIFLPNGTYDLGETVLTQVSGSNIAIIGQSRDGVVIKNAPDASTESINNTATLYLTGTNIYLQDLTIQNALDYYKNDNGRAVALWAKNSKTICKNVRLLSYQDTYYSNKIGGMHYFEDCEIHGTVDFICGDGTVYFKNNLLYAEKRKKDGGGSDALTAANTDASDKGYVFEGCRIQSVCPTVSLGRMWNNAPQCVFLNTVLDYSAGNFSLTGSGIERWTLELMTAGAWPGKAGHVGEYNTMDTEGNVVSPASNNVTFFKGTDTQTYETILTADEAAAYSYSNVFGAAWDPAADAVQTELTYTVSDNTVVWDATTATIFLVENAESAEVVTALPTALPEGTTVRAANARGGFGPAATKKSGTALDNTSAEELSVRKTIENGQVLIIKNGVRYNLLGSVIE